MSEIQTVLICGRGAIGALYGNEMRKAGRHPAFMADAKRLLRYSSQPFVINGEEVSFQYGLEGTADLVLFTSKYYDLPACIEAVKPYIGPETILLPCQNGIASEDLLCKTFDPVQVIRTVVQGMDSVYDGKTCTYSKTGEFVIGPEYPGQEPLCTAVQTFLESANLHCRISSDIRLDQYRKLMANCALNQLCAAHGLTYGQIVSPAWRQTFYDVMAEVMAVANAQNIPLRPEDIEQWIHITSQLDPSAMPSMAQDALHGRPMEIDLFSGTIVPLAHSLGVPVPGLEALWEQLKQKEGNVPS
jgi:2-dehydropantoate 2-reductase